MPKLPAALAAALSLTVPAVAAAQAPAAPAAQPARWHLDGSTDRCVLRRTLQGTPAAANFILRSIPGSGRYDVILAAPGLPGDFRRTGRSLSLSFLPGGQARSFSPARVDLPQGLGDGAAYGPLPAEFLQELARASTLQVADGEGRALGSWTVPLGARAAEAFAACEAEKLTDWGADPAGFEPGAIRARPQGDPAGWLTIRDLGLGTATASLAYTAVFRLVVDGDGRASDCTLIESAGNVDLSGACRVLRSRARFEPARDPAGNAIRSVAVQYLGWRMDVDFRWVE
jgi:hypothetical protein